MAERLYKKVLAPGSYSNLSEFVRSLLICRTSYDTIENSVVYQNYFHTLF